MRTTIDLDDSVLQRLKDDAHREGIAFRTMLHRVIQRGLEHPAAAAEAPYKLPAVSLQLASSLEDEEIVRKLAERR